MNNAHPVTGQMVEFLTRSPYFKRFTEEESARQAEESRAARDACIQRYNAAGRDLELADGRLGAATKALEDFLAKQRPREDELKSQIILAEEAKRRAGGEFNRVANDLMKVHGELAVDHAYRLVLGAIDVNQPQLDGLIASFNDRTRILNRERLSAAIDSKKDLLKRLRDAEAQLKPLQMASGVTPQELKNRVTEILAACGLFKPEISWGADQNNDD